LAQFLDFSFEDRKLGQEIVSGLLGKATNALTNLASLVLADLQVFLADLKAGLEFIIPSCQDAKLNLPQLIE
jgi:hypothetical protein